MINLFKVNIKKKYYISDTKISKYLYLHVYAIHPFIPL